MPSTQEISMSLMEKEFLFDFLLQVQQKKEQRFIIRYDGPFLVVSHANGRQDLLQLRHLTTGIVLRSVNIEKIVGFRVVIQVQTCDPISRQHCSYRMLRPHHKDMMFFPSV